MVGRLRTLFARRAYIFKKSVHPILEHRELPEWIPTSNFSASSLRHHSFTSVRSKILQPWGTLVHHSCRIYL